jgi:hypothetical protein
MYVSIVSVYINRAGKNISMRRLTTDRGAWHREKGAHSRFRMMGPTAKQKNLKNKGRRNAIFEGCACPPIQFSEVPTVRTSSSTVGSSFSTCRVKNIQIQDYLHTYSRLIQNISASGTRSYARTHTVDLQTTQLRLLYYHTNSLSLSS